MSDDAPEDNEDDKKKSDGNEEGAEGEGGEGAPEGGEGGKKKISRNKLILMIAVPVVLLIGGGAAAYFTGMLDSVLGAKPPAAEGEEHAADAGEGGGHGGDGHGGVGAFFVKMPDMVVNLSSEEGQTQRYLRLSVQLEVANEAEGKTLEALMPRVIDQFQTYLRELRVRDLRGSAGLYRLQIELLSRVNQAAAPVKVKDVLFQEILIQ